MSRVIHFEIPADDPGKSGEFYKKAFGWKITPWGDDNSYWLVETGDKSDPGIDGAIIKRRIPNMPVVNTIQVEILEVAIRIIESHGGRVVIPKFAMPGVGWVLYFQDPEGIVMGLLEPNPNAK
jgi:predicted enzyme related to lactoylglutathione lyase